MINSIRLFYTLAAVLFFSFGSFAQEMQWYSWEEGYKKAKEENKIIVLDAYTEWCGWCKVMDRETYSQKSVQDKIEAEFIAIKLNPELSGTYVFESNNYSGDELIKKLSKNKFRGYPSTFFVYPNTGNSYMEVGYIKADPFGKLLNKYATKN
ncbi:MAG: hypothetical protein DRI95_03940 [Bacteroidetes bacterium]|nr:MAG: hypothetical protein DRI95_03940 [Bacteroidota bacterium]